MIETFEMGVDPVAWFHQMAKSFRPHPQLYGPELFKNSNEAKASNIEIGVYWTKRFFKDDGCGMTRAKLIKHVAERFYSSGKVQESGDGVAANHGLGGRATTMWWNENGVYFITRAAGNPIAIARLYVESGKPKADIIDDPSHRVLGRKASTWLATPTGTVVILMGNNAYTRTERGPEERFNKVDLGEEIEKRMFRIRPHTTFQKSQSSRAMALQGIEDSVLTDPGNEVLETIHTSNGSVHFVIRKIRPLKSRQPRVGIVYNDELYSPSSTSRLMTKIGIHIASVQDMVAGIFVIGADVYTNQERTDLISRRDDRLYEWPYAYIEENLPQKIQDMLDAAADEEAERQHKDLIERARQRYLAFLPDFLVKNPRGTVEKAPSDQEITTETKPGTGGGGGGGGGTNQEQTNPPTDDNDKEPQKFAKQKVPGWDINIEFKDERDPVDDSYFYGQVDYDKDTLRCTVTVYSHLPWFDQSLKVLAEEAPHVRRAQTRRQHFEAALRYHLTNTFQILLMRSWVADYQRGADADFAHDIVTPETLTAVIESRQPDFMAKAKQISGEAKAGVRRIGKKA